MDGWMFNIGSTELKRLACNSLRKSLERLSRDSLRKGSNRMTSTYGAPGVLNLFYLLKEIVYLEYA